MFQQVADASASTNGQAEALSQAVNLMNQMGMGPVLSTLCGAQGLLYFLYISR